jgi:hypothetical protein
VVKLQLNDGVTLSVDVGLEEMQGAYEAALAGNRMLQITSADGTTRAVNPNQVLYLEANGNGEAEDPAVLREADSTPAGSL